MPRDKFNLVPGDNAFKDGYQIVTIRRPKSRKVPKWVFNDEAIRKLLLKSFPKSRVDAAQRLRAGRWARVIQLYFRMKKSYSETAEEMGEKPRTIEMIIRSIFRVSKGKPADGRKRKKKHAVVSTESGE